MAISTDNTTKSVTGLQEKLELDATSKAWGIPINIISENCERGTHYDKKGWWIQKNGIYPQFRFDSPGDMPKYVGLKDVLPDICIPILSECYHDPFSDSTYALPTIITEGWKKAVILMLNGFRAVSVAGVWNGLRSDKDGSGSKTKRYIVPSLQKLITEKHITEYMFCFDADIAFNDSVKSALNEATVALKKEGCTVFSVTGKWDVKDGKGIDDYINNGHLDAFKQLVGDAIKAGEYTPKKPSASSTDKKRGSKIVDSVEAIKEFYGSRLTYNGLKTIIELDGNRWNADDIRIKLAYDTGIELSNSDAIQFVESAAKINAYHPVVQYLDRVSSVPCGMDANSAMSRLTSLWNQVLGINEPLPISQMTKTLVGAVARAFKPGCMMRTVTILYGGQNIGKSTFWRELMGERFYSDAYEGTSEKDDLLKLHKAFIHEIPEIDAIYRKTDASRLKRNISQRQDEIRVPFGKDTVTRDRQCIITGTTNSQDILRDTTGSTRFWVITVLGCVNIDLLISVRDEIWSLAVLLYKAGYSWELTREEQILNDEVNIGFSTVDLIDEVVEQFCRSKDSINGWKEFIEFRYVIAHCFPDKTDASVPSADQRRVREALTRLGYRTGTHRISGQPVRVWRRLDVTPVTVAQEKCYATVTPLQQSFEPSVTPVTAINQTLVKQTDETIATGNHLEENTICENVAESTVTGVTLPGSNTVQALHYRNSSVTVDRVAVTDVEYCREGDVKVGDVVELTRKYDSVGDRGTRHTVIGFYSTGVMVAITNKSIKSQKKETLSRPVSYMDIKLIR
ncbi:VapE domain-containing protein [Nostoc sp.]|uniref:VapE domain-containing protein n=1 Tax=Nostoc sp. TaxID=1180 RepID=UPI002FFBB4EA